MIWTCLMKSFNVSRHMPSIITWVTQCCRYCQECNLYSCSQNTIIWIFSSHHYIQCPLQMDLLPLFLYLMSKPFWLHFLMIPWECTRRTLHPIMISLQEKQNCQRQLLMKYILDHFGSRPDKKYCGDDPDASPLALVCFYDLTNTDVFGPLSCAPFICTPSFLKKTVAMMTQITWFWVISPILDMEKEKQKNRQLRWNYRMNTTVFH